MRIILFTGKGGVGKTTLAASTALLSARQGVDSIEAEELSVFPGMEELFSLMEIRQYNRTADYEVIIVDCAPTGDTPRPLSAPEITNWYLKHLFPFQRRAAKAVRPVANRLLPFPFPQDSASQPNKKPTGPT